MWQMALRVCRSLTLPSKSELVFLFMELQHELLLRRDITNVMSSQTQSLQRTDLTNNSLMFFILTFYEISKEIFTTGFFQSPDLCEIIIIFQPTKNRSGNILKIHY